MIAVMLASIASMFLAAFSVSVHAHAQAQAQAQTIVLAIPANAASATYKITEMSYKKRVGDQGLNPSVDEKVHFTNVSFGYAFLEAPVGSTITFRALYNTPANYELKVVADGNVTIGGETYRVIRREGRVWAPANTTPYALNGEASDEMRFNKDGILIERKARAAAGTGVHHYIAELMDGKSVTKAEIR